MTCAGLSVKDTFESCQDKFGTDAPASLSTFYKYYKNDMSRARADTISSIGNKVVEQARQGDFKSQELYLRSKGGWSPNATVNEGEDQSELEEAEDAISTLKRLLGKD